MATRTQNISMKFGAKVLVIGHRRVGKTTLINQLSRMVATVRSDGRHRANRKRGGTNLTGDSFWFMEATLRDMPYFRRLTIGTADAFILTCAFDEDESFDYVTTLIKDVREVKGKDVPLIIVSNKADIEIPTQKRTMADCILTTDYDCRHMEINALDENNVKNVLAVLREQYVQYTAVPDDNEDNENNNNHLNNDRTLKKKQGTLLRRFLCIPRHH